MTRTCLVLTAGALAAAACITPSAHAAETLPTPSAADLAAATQAASGEGLDLAAQVAAQAGVQADAQQPSVAASSKARSSARSASGDAAGSGSASGSASAAIVPGTTTVVRTLSPRFVASGQGPVATVSYVANTARAGGRTVSVWSAPAAKGGWEAVNAATGDVEAQMAARAQGAPVFVEPQVNAWYALDGDTVRPLNDDARAAVGDGVSLARYQRIVHDRYAAMQSGSSYERQGKAGGFAEPAAVAAKPAAPASAGGSPAPWLAGAAALVVAAGAAVALRRSRA